jgi:hypothetical protein
MKNDTEKYKCQLHHSISKTVTLFALSARAAPMQPRSNRDEER